MSAGGVGRGEEAVAASRARVSRRCRTETLRRGRVRLEVVPRRSSSSEHTQGGGGQFEAWRERTRSFFAHLVISCTSREKSELTCWYAAAHAASCCCCW